MLIFTILTFIVATHGDSESNYYNNSLCDMLDTAVPYMYDSYIKPVSAENVSVKFPDNKCFIPPKHKRFVTIITRNFTRGVVAVTSVAIQINLKKINISEITYDYFNDIDTLPPSYLQCMNTIVIKILKVVSFDMIEKDVDLFRMYNALETLIYFLFPIPPGEVCHDKVWDLMKTDNFTRVMEHTWKGLNCSKFI